MQATGNSNIDDWQRVGIRSIVQQTELAKAEGKWLFIWDKTNTLNTFFKYKGVLCEFYTEVIKVELGRQTPAEALEVVRKDFVNAQRTGDNLMIDLSMTQPDFFTKYTSEDVFPVAKAFNRAEWLNQEVHMRFVKEEENFSIGGLNPGHYVIQPDFKMSLCSSAENEEHMAAVISKIPCFDQFKCVVVE